MKINPQKTYILREGTYSSIDLEKLKKVTPNVKIKNIFPNQVAELFEIKNPKLLFEDNFKEEQLNYINLRSKSDKEGDWIYFPWSDTLLHTVSEIENVLLRTIRNRNIISEMEQNALRSFKVAIAGLSVGGNIALNLAYSGISDDIKLSDFDTLETTNLNRVRARLDQVGDSKIDIVAQQIYDINPYANIITFPEGLNEKTLSSFITGTKKTDLIFEIIDDFKMKIKIRLLAKEKGVPVIMLTNLGDRILVDVERYDLDKNIAIFNGLIGDVSEEILLTNITKEDEKKFAIQIVEVKNIPKKVIESVQEIGNTLTGRPQLMSTASASSGIATYLARRIALGLDVPSGRKLFKLSDCV